MGLSMARRARRLRSDEEKRSIWFQTAAPGVSVAQVARRGSTNADMVFKWLRDPQDAPVTEPVADTCTSEVVGFTPVEVVCRTGSDDGTPVTGSAPPAGTIEIDIAGGHRLRIVGTYDFEALARLIRGLSP